MIDKTPLFLCVHAMQYDLTILGNDEAAFETAQAANNQGLKTLVVVSENSVSAWQKTRALHHMASETMAGHDHLSDSNLGQSLAAKFYSYLQIELQEFNTSLRTAGIDVLNARVEFENAGALKLKFPDFTRPVTIESRNIVVATGIQRTAFPFCDQQNHLDASDQILNATTLPQRTRIIGGGDFGAALAACLQLSGVTTQLISRTQYDSSTLELASTCGVEIADHPDDFEHNCTQGSQQHIVDCRGRQGLTQGLNLDTIAVEADEHGQLWCGRHFETWCRGVYGAGDVVGFSPDSTNLVATQAQIIVNRVCGLQDQEKRTGHVNAEVNTAIQNEHAA